MRSVIVQVAVARRSCRCPGCADSRRAHSCLRRSAGCRDSPGSATARARRPRRWPCRRAATSFIVVVDDAQVDERHGQAGLAAQSRLSSSAGRCLEAGRQLREGQQRAGLRHAVAGEHVDAALRSAARARPAAAREPPMIIFQPRRSTSGFAGSPSSICRIVGTQCENVTRSCAISSQQHLGHVAAGIDLLHAQQGRDVGHAPARARGTSASSACRRRRDGSAALAGRLASAAIIAMVCSTSWRWLKYTPFGQAGRAGGVERRGAGVLVEVGEVVVGRARRQQRLVFADRNSAAPRPRRLSSISDELARPSSACGLIASSSGRKSACTSTVGLGVVDRVERSAPGERRTLTVCSTAPIIGTAK